MKRYKRWTCLIIISFLLIALAGCREQAVPDFEDHPTTETSGSSDVPAADTSWLVGIWENYSRYDDNECSSLIVRTILLYENGKGEILDAVLVSWNDQTGEECEPSEATKETLRTDTIAYTLEGDRLSITYLENDEEDYPDYTVVYTVTSSDDGMMTWDPVDESTYERLLFVNMDLNLLADIVNLCDVFNIQCRLFDPDAPVTPDNTEDTKEPEPATPEEDKPDAGWLKGSWSTVTYEKDTEHGDLMETVNEISFGFGADGSGSINARGWVRFAGEAWQPGGMGYAESYFDYILDGNMLTIIHTGNEFNIYPEEERKTEVYTVTRNQDGSITWIPAEGGESRVYRKIESDLPMEELLTIFDIDLPEA